MTVFHGSNIEFDTVSLDFAKDRRDFGRGFYTTTIREQAEDWAKNICGRNKTKTAYIYEFEFFPAELTVKTFDAITKEWLDFIIENRVRGGVRHPFDIVTGPVANDKTMDTIGFFLAGIYTVEEALSRLKYMKANNQVSFHNVKAISHLRLVRRYEWNV